MNVFFYHQSNSQLDFEHFFHDQREPEVGHVHETFLFSGRVLMMPLIATGEFGSTDFTISCTQVSKSVDSFGRVGPRRGSVGVEWRSSRLFFHGLTTMDARLMMLLSLEDFESLGDPAPHHFQS